MSCTYTRLANVRKRFEEMGATAHGITPEKFAQVIATDIAKYAVVIRISGAKVD